MKQLLVKMVRGTLPKGAIRGLEELYRGGRVRLVQTYYGNPGKGLNIIAVTGTNGKTTTVNYLNEILKEAGYKTAMFSTAEIEVAGKRKLNDLNATVPTTAQVMSFLRQAKRAQANYVVLEVTSHALQQHKLDSLKPAMAVMTNLTQDHLDYFKTMENYAAAKGLLFSGEPRFIVLNRDDEWFEFFNKFDAEELKITYGQDGSANVRIDKLKLYKNGTEAQLALDGEKLEVATSLTGEFNAYNMAAAAAAASLLGASGKQISEGIANLKTLPGRFERAVKGLDYEVVIDYAHTPDALERLLKSAKQVTEGRVILVFGATGDRDKGKRPIMGEIAAREADLIFVTDEENYTEPAGQIRAQVIEGISKAGGMKKTEEIADRRAAIKEALNTAEKGDLVLITGMGHEVYRITNGKRIPWNDGDVVRELLGQPN
ncbi:MAG: UDP-N-acetylmuramoyl-L-alanyl-D-glutamate--2,6-diaminopimelate ligase [Candidatus Nomurabacteria bacterium]|jgi:UDP-N-acetylmuramoyl-L-alanyl-D-glutamate--2,6-diaminopimelate ligase|nr:UDP-N-acetylmuramoyl-L-alanyl-D-glutamate--2,6-diaminopimelate ligase [Candidatus Nomurabacteria bacterium]